MLPNATTILVHRVCYAIGLWNNNISLYISLQPHLTYSTLEQHRSLFFDLYYILDVTLNLCICLSFSSTFVLFFVLVDLVRFPYHLNPTSKQCLVSMWPFTSVVGLSLSSVLSILCLSTEGGIQNTSFLSVIYEIFIAKIITFVHNFMLELNWLS